MSTTALERAPHANAVAKQGFGEQSISTTGETAAIAVAEQARALVQARYVMALERPRDWDDVRTRLMRECQRPRFAEAARYHVPRGKGIEGPSIRFAEAAARCMGNLDNSTTAVYDDPSKRIIRVNVTDLEANLSYPKDVVIDKTIERRSLKEGQQAVSVRLNSQGQRTYLVPTTDDDLLMKENSLVSKALRTGILRILPADILEDCMDLVIKVLNDKHAKDPEGERKKLIDAFATLNVLPSHLKEYLGHEIGMTTPGEMTTLRGIYQSLKEGRIESWSQVMAEKAPEQKKGDTDASSSGKKSSLKEKLESKAQQKQEAPEEAPNDDDLDPNDPTREPGSEG